MASVTRGHAQLFVGLCLATAVIAFESGGFAVVGGAAGAGNWSQVSAQSPEYRRPEPLPPIQKVSLFQRAGSDSLRARLLDMNGTAPTDLSNGGLPVALFTDMALAVSSGAPITLPEAEVWEIQACRR